MQTFLPLSDFTQSARCLDRFRLGKQRVETLEILVTLSETKPIWMTSDWFSRCISHNRHPAVLMWKGYETSLSMYGVAVCLEWERRGYRDRLEHKIASYQTRRNKLPPWLGKTKFHSSHRSNLLRKNYEHYSQFGWKESANLEYWWPTKHEKEIAKDH